jgi:hypothetical protein
VTTAATDIARPESGRAPQTSALRVLTLGLRVVTAGLLGATAGIHLDLWSSYGYRHIPTIGALFLLNGIAGSILAVAVMGLPNRILPAATIGAAVFAASTLVALVISINGSLFGFTETSQAPLISQAIAVEAGTIVAAGALTGVRLMMMRSKDHR